MPIDLFVQKKNAIYALICGEFFNETVKEELHTKYKRLTTLQQAQDLFREVMAHPMYGVQQKTLDDICYDVQPDQDRVMFDFLEFYCEDIANLIPDDVNRAIVFDPIVAESDSAVESQVDVERGPKRPRLIGPRNRPQERQPRTRNVNEAFQRGVILQEGVISITSPPQSGKTEAILTRAILRTYQGIVPVIAVRHKPDLQQLKTRIFKKLLEMEQFMVKHGVAPIQFNVCSILKAASERIKIRDAMNLTKPSILICLANDSKFKRLEKLKSEYPTTKLDLMVDEADYVLFGKSATHETFLRMQQSLFACAYISATPLDQVWGDRRLTPSRQIKLTPHPDYRGLLDFICHPLVKSVPRSVDSDEMIDVDMTYDEFYEKIFVEI